MGGILWCSKDPLVRIQKHEIRLYGLLPLEFEDTYESIDFTISVPPGTEREVLHEEPRETVRFVEDPRLAHGYRDGRTRVEISARVRGVDDREPFLLMVIATRNGTSATTQGRAEGVHDILLLEGG